MPLSEALWYTAKNQVEIKPLDVPPPREGEVLLRTVVSGISRGTERLVLQGRVPESEHKRMRCPYQDGAFPFPVKYGYALVALVEDGPEQMRGRLVFALHPHQRHVCLAADHVHLLPSEIPASRAALAANMETALNVLWDAEVMPGDSVLIVGGGVVGLLIAALAARIPGTKVFLVDPQESRRPLASHFGASFSTPAKAPGDQDVVIHASGHPDGLALGLTCAGVEAKIVEASWYGASEVSLPLGESFHARRLSLISSQVGAVPARQRARWSNHRRLQTAISLLADPRLDALIDRTVAFQDAPRVLPDILGGTDGLATILTYN